MSKPAPWEVCPHCNAACGAPSLLTSMTRYYLCGSCAARWQIARNWQIVQDGMVDADGAPEPGGTRIDSNAIPLLEDGDRV